MEHSNEAYNHFIEEYSSIYSACFPLKVLKSELNNEQIIFPLAQPWSSDIC